MSGREGLPPELSKILHDWHKRMHKRKCYSLWERQKAPTKFLFLCHISNGSNVSFSIRQGRGVQCYVSKKFQTLKFDPHTVVTIIYHSMPHILHSLALFMLTPPFPMSRHLSQPGDTGNAFYCNTSILSVLALLLPPLVLSWPAVLCPTQGWIQ